MTRPIVEVEGLTKRFAVGGGLLQKPRPLHAVDGVDLHVNEGQTFAIVGESGCGKSTLARLLMRLLEPSEGRIRVAGRDISDLAGADLRADPARLGDEARSSSLFGDKRHIWCRVAGDEAHEAIKILLETGDMGAGEACPVIVVATGATDKSRTAKLLEKRKDAVVAMFYPPDLRSVTQTVRAMGDAAETGSV